MTRWALAARWRARCRKQRPSRTNEGRGFADRQSVSAAQTRGQAPKASRPRRSSLRSPVSVCGTQRVSVAARRAISGSSRLACWLAQRRAHR